MRAELSDLFARKPFITEHLAKLAFHQMQYFFKWEWPVTVNMVNYKFQEKN